MKITKRQLKRIIKEEKQKLVKEYGGIGSVDSSVGELFSILRSMDAQERNVEIYSIIDDLEELARTGE